MLHTHTALISGHIRAPNPMSSAAFDFIFPLWGWKNLSVQPGDGLSLSFWRPRGKGRGGKQSPWCWCSGQGAGPRPHLPWQRLSLVFSMPPVAPADAPPRQPLRSQEGQRLRPPQSRRRTAGAGVLDPEAGAGVEGASQRGGGVSAWRCLSVEGCLSVPLRGRPLAKMRGLSPGKRLLSLGGPLPEKGE